MRTADVFPVVACLFPLSGGLGRVVLRVVIYNWSAVMGVKTKWRPGQVSGKKSRCCLLGNGRILAAKCEFLLINDCYFALICENTAKNFDGDTVDAKHQTDRRPYIKLMFFQLGRPSVQTSRHRDE